MSPSHSTTVVLLAQGDELTAGQTVDTNSAWLAKELSLLGYTMAGIEICPDDPAIICEALKRANQRAGLVISTGGLGPTEDDYTAEGAADGQDMRSRCTNQVSSAFKKSGHAATERCRSQIASKP